jgi:DNA-binding transcriptional regulator GbsR (MarR family)
MTEPTSSPTEGPAPDPVRAFVEHWGTMARAWGINPTMGELFALLYITGTDWTAEGLRAHLKISRGNVSMNLRELLNWGVIHKVHRQGERREYYRAEADVWTLFRRILAERKRRELDPTLATLEQTARLIRDHPELAALHERVAALERFFRLINRLALQLSRLDSEDLDALLAMLGHQDDPPPGLSKD